jgi:hypothetical protein
MRCLLGSIVLISMVFSSVFASQARDVPSELEGTQVKIQSIVEDEAAYHQKSVVVFGKITDECGSGCWFILNDGTASVYVDILPGNFVIPQKRGSFARVFGTVTTKDGDPMILGKMVEIDGTVYQYQKG